MVASHIVKHVGHTDRAEDDLMGQIWPMLNVIVPLSATVTVFIASAGLLGNANTQIYKVVIDHR